VTLRLIVFEIDEETGAKSVKDIKEQQEVARVLIKFFMDKLKGLKGDIDPKYIKDALEFFKNIPLLELFRLHTVSEQEVREEILKLKSKPSSGLDGITSMILKCLIGFIEIPLTRIVNTSIKTGVFPSAWKLAKVIPVYKNKGSKNKKENYRPVSLLPVASKVLESIVRKQLSKFFEKNNHK